MVTNSVSFTASTQTHSVVHAFVSSKLLKHAIFCFHFLFFSFFSSAVTYDLGKEKLCRITRTNKKMAYICGSAHICLTGTNVTKPQLESRLITSADAEGVTSHITQRWLLYDHAFNLGVTLLQNTGLVEEKKKKTTNKKIPLNHFTLPLKCNLISNTSLRFNCRN